jgi:hypothetical protein
MTMDVTRSHAAGLPSLDDRWRPTTFGRDELRDGLLAGGIAGPQVSHPMDNVRRNIQRLTEGDPDKTFGMSGLQTFTPGEVLELVAKAAGFDPDPAWLEGPVPIDPDLVLDACEAAGDRLAEAVRRGERVIVATGHPVGLAHLYVEIARLLRAGGADLLEPFEGVWYSEPRDDGLRQVRYLGSVAMTTDGRSMRHTHSDRAMARMLEQVRPDLVLADHGFAGAAIERGVETMSVADVNDPALIVARAQGRTDVVIVMDDNVRPEDYWPCFQVVAARLS